MEAHLGRGIHLSHAAPITANSLSAFRFSSPTQSATLHKPFLQSYISLGMTTQLNGLQQHFCKFSVILSKAQISSQLLHKRTFVKGQRNLSCRQNQILTCTSWYTPWLYTWHSHLLQDPRYFGSSWVLLKECDVWAVIEKKGTKKPFHEASWLGE